jgi:hypothetical protein
MKNGNWIALHKELRYFLPSGREYTILEAMFSYTLDIDNGKEGTISGYSKLWGWSRTKVRKFIEELQKSEGHLTNRQRTGKRHQILLKLNNLKERKDTLKTLERHLKDTTINPNPNPKKNIYCEFPDLNLEAWQKWLDYKRLIKNKYKTENGERTKIKALIELSGGDKRLQMKLVDQAINEEWKGIHGLREGNNGKGRAVHSSQRETSTDRAADKLRRLEEEYFNASDDT